MAKKTSDLAYLLGPSQKRKFIRECTSDLDFEFEKKSAKLKAFAVKWIALTAQTRRYERRLLRSFLDELMGILHLSSFDGSSGDYDFERGTGRRPHDCVSGQINVEDDSSQFVTAIEAKYPDWNLDLDRNEKGETVLEQAIHVSTGNPFLRQIITTNFCTFRFYVPLFGFEHFHQFRLEQLAVNEDERAYFLALTTHNLLCVPTSPLRNAFTQYIEQSLSQKRTKIDGLYAIYADTLSAATRDAGRSLPSHTSIASRQLATQLVNRVLFTEYSNQIGLHDVSISEHLTSGAKISLHKLFEVMDSGGKFNGRDIPHFNGGLFQRNAALDSISLSSRTFSNLRSLSRLELADLAPEILGRIFERSLSEDLSELPNSPTESDSLGAVYTPNFLAAAMTKLCFSMVDENPTILDPACGSGVFLLEALKQSLSSTESRKSNSISSILNSRISGWDINPAAVELTRFMIWQHVADLELPLPSIKNNIHVGDGVLDPLSTYKSKPDIVIGNPPFIAHQNLRRDYKNQLESKYTTTLDPKHQYDICIAFFERALNVVKDDGVVAFVAPNQLAFRPYAQKLRDYILEKHQIERVVDLTQAQVFDKAICPFVYVIQKGKSKPVRKTFPVYTDIRSQSEIVDAFELAPSKTAFAEMAHTADLRFLARGLVASGVSSIDNWMPELATASRRSMSSVLTAKPHRGKVKSVEDGQYTVKVATPKLKNGFSTIKSVKVNRAEKQKIEDRYGAEKIVFPRFFPSQMAVSLHSSAIAVADNVYYLTSKDLKPENQNELAFISHLLNSRFYSLLDFARCGLDRINKFGFRAMDGDKFADLAYPDSTLITRKRISKLFAKMQAFHSLADDASFGRAAQRTAIIRSKRIIQFEREVAKYLGFNLTDREVVALLRWWAEVRSSFTTEVSVDQEAA